MPLRLVTLAVLALLAPAVPAAAQDRELDVEGSVVVRWHGDLSRGCEDADQCDVSGTITWQPDVGAIEVDPIDDHRGFLDASSGAIARTVRSGNAECLDRGGDGPHLLTAVDGRLRLESLDGTSGIDSGRCSGPLGPDLADALPSAAVPGDLGPGDTLDFRGTRAFAAGPFTGEVVSTLTARVGAPRHTTGLTGTNVGARSRRTEQLAVHYRIDALTGQLAVDWWGLPAPHCHALDVCGASGRVVQSVTASDGAFQVFASRRTSRRRTTVGRALRALRRGRSDVSAFGSADDVDTSVSASSTRTDGDLCASTVDAGAPSLEGELRPSGLALLVTAGQGALRTRCAGPDDRDVVGPAGVLLYGTIDRDDVGAKRIRVSLGRTGGWTAAGRQGIRTSAGQVVLRRTLIRATVGR